MAAFAATTLMAAPASAKLISFADFDAGNEGGIANGSSIDFGDGVVIGFESNSGLNASSGGWSRSIQYNPYFDDVSGGKPGGLGVCRALDGAAGNGAPGAECADASDDSIDGEMGSNEGIILTFFGQNFDLLSLSFRDGDHNSLNASNGLVYFFQYSPARGDVVFGTTTFADLVMRAIAGEFTDTNTFGLRYVNTEFYLEAISDVPLPAALPVLLAGLGGLGFASRKRKNTA
ncbi:VPLPA-CTERM sorting domain-containing protein [Hyphococcus sp.]|uniref:VPLPA-CTERM sorting domain-containing protein n=1 Tax=Hyphococcus sp. TaxID=2038636 RepID=UPI00208C55DA|nr:MAG: hypothetical protein DHS20C04_05030 [Marinicaulis sp.]